MADATKSKQKLSMFEKKLLMNIQGKTFDRIHNTEIRKCYKFQNITKFVKDRQKYCKGHMNRMENDQLVKAEEEDKPLD